MDTAKDNEHFDLVVVGASIYGLAVARTYLGVNPTARMLILDTGHSIGGTWASERLYHGLCTNNLVGMVEYSDFPMDPKMFGVEPGTHVPGSVIHRYLTLYAQKFGIWDKIKFNTVAKSTELMSDNKWLITYAFNSKGEHSENVKVIASKLVLATGTTHQPHMPSIPGAEEFTGHLFHFKELPKRNEEMAVAKNIVVLGGSKSAADAVWLNASKGRHVDWVIRASGRGPAWLSSSYVSPANLQFEKLALTRFMTFLSPCFNSDGYTIIRKFFHNTFVGRAMLKGFFGIIHQDLITRGKFNDHPETKKLIPKSNIFWFGTTVGIFNYPVDLFQLIREGKIHVHIADISSLSQHSVHLSDGNTIDADVLICATGWKHKPTVTFLPEKILDKIGVVKLMKDDSSVQAADEEIMRRFPGLKDQPPAATNAQHDEEKTSYLLYRGLVPPAFMSSRNLAYCGQAISLRGFLVAQVQALWITAFLDGKLSTPLPSEAEAEWDALLQSRFYRWRAPHGLGPKSTDMTFEVMPFIDTLLQDLGLPTRRKGGWRELFEGYGVADYRELVEEWINK